MAEHASGRDGASKVGIGFAFVTGRESVSRAAEVISYRRLKKVIAEVHDVAAGMSAGAYDVIDMVGGCGAVAGECLP